MNVRKPTIEWLAGIGLCLVMFVAGCSREASPVVPETAPRAAHESSLQNVGSIDSVVPSPLTVVLTPSPATTAREITAEINPPRSDGDDPVFFEWSVNGNIIDGETGPILGHAHFKKRDMITVKVYSGPASDLGRILLAASQELPVLNAAPVIESSRASVQLEDGRYETTIIARDPDDDPVTFRLEEGPDGMTLDPKSGLLRWTPPRDMKHPAHVIIAVSDNEGLESRLALDLHMSISAENEDGSI